MASCDTYRLKSIDYNVAMTFILNNNNNNNNSKTSNNNNNQWSLLMAGDDEMFITRSLNVTPKTPEQHLIVYAVINLQPM